MHLLLFPIPKTAYVAELEDSLPSINGESQTFWDHLPAFATRDFFDFTILLMIFHLLNLFQQPPHNLLGRLSGSATLRKSAG